jgi:tripartite-type tricarboxylate transporter receptor subunit TctC
MPDMKEREAQLGYRYIGGSPEELAAFLKHDIAKWQDLGKKGSFK